MRFSDEHMADGNIYVDHHSELGNITLLASSNLHNTKTSLFCHNRLHFFLFEND